MATAFLGQAQLRLRYIMGLSNTIRPHGSGSRRTATELRYERVALARR
jgi:hypothetical protein